MTVTVLLGVMAVTVASPDSLTIPEIAALLDVEDNQVDAVVRLGRAKVFFTEISGNRFFISGPLLELFLRDAARSGEFFISPMALDAMEKQVLELSKASGNVEADKKKRKLSL